MRPEKPEPQERLKSLEVIIMAEPQSPTEPEIPLKTLTPAAQRALEEAQARRNAATHQDRPVEVNGRAGPEPVRYGDWENKGIASDF